jgi:hypothetical protein
MPTFRVPANEVLGTLKKTGALRLKREAFAAFTPAVLGLGDIDREAKSFPTVAAYFDLQGFTAFSRQIEPHLSIPVFLSAFLDWIFAALRDETLMETAGSEVRLRHDLPFFIKFMGDGILVLWCTAIMGDAAQHNLIISLLDICSRYEKDFGPQMKRKVVDAPRRLRCGVAKGMVFSVGNGEDYVGSCINLAARLQKLHGLKFAFARRGFDPETAWNPEARKSWLLKMVSIRGIGDHELVYVPKADFESLSKTDQTQFKDV